MATNLFSISIDESGVLTAFTGSGTWAVTMNKIANPAPEKKVKTRKTREWTDEERAAFHARMVEARLKKISAKGKSVPTIVESVNPEVKIEPNTEKVEIRSAPKAIVVTKPAKTHTPVSVGRKNKLLPMPKTGHKVRPKPASR